MQALDATELSIGDMHLTHTTALTDMQLIPVDHPDSAYAAFWAARIGNKLDEGWRTAYSDSTRRDNHHTAVSHHLPKSTRGPATTSQYLGTLASVADAGRLGIALSLESNLGQDMLLLLTDSMAAYNSALNLSRGSPPRSGIEIRIARALAERRHLDTGISWVRSHIGIPGNKLADKAADYQSHLGQTDGSPNITTYEGFAWDGRLTVPLP